MSEIDKKKLEEQVKAFANSKVKNLKSDEKNRDIEVSLYFTGGRDIL